jgi:hypothetical protein
MYVHGGPFEGIPVVDLYSKEEDAFPDTSRDEEFAKQVFSDLNHGLIGLLGDDNIIILSDSDEEEEVCEENIADAKAVAPSVVNSPSPTISTTDANDASKGM